MIMNAAVRLLDIAARNYPDRPAVSDWQGTFTYREYREYSRKTGCGLLQADAGRRPVIVYLAKSTQALFSFMGAQYAGCPYVPVDSHIPVLRLQKIIESVHPSVIITDEDLCKNLSGIDIGGIRICLISELMNTEVDDAVLDSATSRVTDADPIYIMYTSGSTGNPKGVTIPHRGILDYASWLYETFQFNENTVMGNQAPFYFDNSTFDIYGSLRCGGHLVLIPENLFLFPGKLPEFLGEWNITSIFWVPMVMINVANTGALENTDLPALKNVAFCGEVMPNRQLNIWRKYLPDCTYTNLYGPTEITDVCCYYRVEREFEDADVLPIGKACENMRVLILTEDGRQADVGEQGEICVLGSGVALGYWNAPEITEKVFVRNPLNAEYYERMYRTGDLGYINEDGLIMFQGRKDNQIKLKGNRIELGEIENAAICVDGVENACAVFDRDHQQIVLFLESQNEYRLRKFNMELRRYIPNYMMPARLVVMKQLPHTANDKIDRVTLKQQI